MIGSLVCCLTPEPMSGQMILQKQIGMLLTKMQLCVLRFDYPKAVRHYHRASIWSNS